VLCSRQEARGERERWFQNDLPTEHIKGIDFWYATISQTGCPPASPEGIADGGQAPGVFHHVIIRRIERRKIVKNKKDRADCLERLADICKADALVRMWRALLL